MSSKIVCDACGHAHDPIPTEACSMLIAYYTQTTTGEAVIIDPARHERRHLDLFLRLGVPHHAAAPAWACNIAHEYDAPLVRDLGHAAAQALAGDFAIHEGMEYSWDGRCWRRVRERAMPRELLH